MLKDEACKGDAMTSPADTSMNGAITTNEYIKWLYTSQ